MKRSLRYNIVDVFTDTPLTGNPLAVFTNAKGLSDTAMQTIAREINLSETVFLFPPESGGHAKLRIFTPRVELPFAGHPVLGSAWVLASPMELGQLVLETGAGPIPIELIRAGDRLHLARMTQPPPTITPYEQESELRAALGTEQRENLLPSIYADNGPQHVLVEVASEDALNALTPDFSALTKLTSAGVLAYFQDGGVCHARYFAPAAGINEDPATGSAAGPLGVHLVARGRHPSGEELIVYQGNAMKRPSTLLVTATSQEGGPFEVKVGGSALVVARGEFYL